MNIQYFNPFRFLNEARSTPHARTLRSSLSQKFLDSYQAFYGNDDFVQTIQTGLVHVGLYDYLTLFIPKLLEKMTSFTVLLYVRAIFSFAFSTICFPLTLIAHSISSIFSSKQTANALKLKGQETLNGLPIGKNAYTSANSFKSLNKLLAENQDSNLEKIRIELIKKPPATPKVPKRISTAQTVDFSDSINVFAEVQGTEDREVLMSKYLLRFWLCPKEHSSINLLSEQAPKDKPFYTVVLNRDNEQKVGALFKLNIGQIVTEIEKKSHLDLTKEKGNSDEEKLVHHYLQLK